MSTCITSEPNDNFLDLSKLKGFAYDKVNVTKTMVFVSYRKENIVGN